VFPYCSVPISPPERAVEKIAGIAKEQQHVRSSSRKPRSARSGCCSRRSTRSPKPRRPTTAQRPTTCPSSGSIATGTRAAEEGRPGDRVLDFAGRKAPRAFRYDRLSPVFLWGGNLPTERRISLRACLSRPTKAPDRSQTVPGSKAVLGSNSQLFQSSQVSLPGLLDLSV
jgi:hypothetical protein